MADDYNYPEQYKKLKNGWKQKEKKSITEVNTSSEECDIPKMDHLGSRIPFNAEENRNKLDVNNGLCNKSDKNTANFGKEISSTKLEIGAPLDPKNALEAKNQSLQAANQALDNKLEEPGQKMKAAIHVETVNLRHEENADESNICGNSKSNPEESTISENITYLTERLLEPAMTSVEMGQDQLEKVKELRDELQALISEFKWLNKRLQSLVETTDTEALMKECHECHTELKEVLHLFQEISKLRYKLLKATGGFTSSQSQTEDNMTSLERSKTKQDLTVNISETEQDEPLGVRRESYLEGIENPLQGVTLSRNEPKTELVGNFEDTKNEMQATVTLKNELGDELKAQGTKIQEPSAVKSKQQHNLPESEYERLQLTTLTRPLENELKAKDREIEQLISSNAELEKKIKEKENGMGEHITSKGKLENKLTAEQHEIEELTTLKGPLENNIKASDSSKTDLECYLETPNNEMQETVSSKKELENKVKAEEAEIQELSAVILKLQQNFTESESKRLQLTTLKETLESELKVKDCKTKELISADAELKRILKEKENAMEKLITSKKQLENKLTAQQNEIEKLTTLKDTLENNIKASDTSNKELENKVEAKEAEIQELNALKSKLQLTLKEEDDKLQQITSSRETLQNLLESKNCEIEKLFSSKAELESKFKEQRIELSTSKQEIEDKLKANENKIEDLTAAKRELETRIQELSSSKNKLSHISKARLCVMCINDGKLQRITTALLEMKLRKQIPMEVHIIMKKLSETLSASSDVFEESSMIILVGIAEPRNMLISESEPSQLGAVYREAVKLGKHIFMVYVSSKYDDHLKDSQPYHLSLESLFQSQKAIGELARTKRFLSVKFKEKENVQKFNSTQCAAISMWITNCLQSYGSSK